MSLPLPSTLFGGLTPREFLERYWQREPLLVRGALPGFESPLSPQELAGLACEEGVDSRLILERGGDHPWQLRSGPFSPSDFKTLPEKGWTLLVQEVDRLIDGAAELLEHFRFVPNWRLDDVMVSYAPPGGSAGPHVDHYDVFLVQGFGRRRWSIRREPLREDERLLELDVRILADFEPDIEWVLEPGDMLYLPPRVPHHGVAVDDCMTYSVGFRAPSHVELVLAFLTEAGARIDPASRYTDREPFEDGNPGRIDPAVLRHVGETIREAAGDEAIAHWFGRFVTEPRREGPMMPEPAWTAADLVRTVGDGAGLRRDAPSHFAFVDLDGGRRSLFVGGEEYVLERDLAFAAELLCGCGRLSSGEIGPHLGSARFVELLVGLYNRGHLEPAE